MADVHVSNQEKSRDILRFFGVLRDADWKKSRVPMNEFRKDFDRKL